MLRSKRGYCSVLRSTHRACDDRCFFGRTGGPHLPSGSSPGRHERPVAGTINLRHNDQPPGGINPSHGQAVSHDNDIIMAYAPRLSLRRIHINARTDTGINPEARVRQPQSAENAFAICRRRTWRRELPFIAGGQADIRRAHSGCLHPDGGEIPSTF